ncbi:hypothetical protein [Rhizobium leguminosarum]|uniref:hypothetical protein n=1 Tax=Rhizobium leguminosarum TaxID=384 RepID=UPI0028C49455|nr:hypothetical protein [Rhizobium leguminosarum]
MNEKMDLASEMSSSINGVKHDFSAAYNQRWPHAYFRAHLSLDYVIPDRAKPVFERILAEYRRVRNRTNLKIIDIGCSYGINAALLRTNLSLDDLYAAYLEPCGSLSRLDLMEHLAFFRNRGLRYDTQFVGLDTSLRAVRYALDVGLLQVGISADLEDRELSIRESCDIAGADIIISTGCVGYVTARTFARVYKATAASRPWVVSFAMRPFSYDDIAAALQDFGLETRHVEQFRQRQRRFSTPAEQQEIATAMIKRGIEDHVERTTGYIYASCYVSSLLDEELELSSMGSQLIPSPGHPA